ncbi:MAG: hypothetical protein WC433_08480 [Candidatus Omnitrophota bacterium]|jgi:hypothetical protein
MENKICPDKRCAFGGCAQPISNFSRDNQTKSGYSAYCKVCRKRRHDEYVRTENGIAVRDKAIKKYRESEHGKNKIKETYLSKEYREKANIYQREYTKRPEVKVNLALKASNYRTRNSLKCRARTVAKNALRCGKIIAPDFCEWCHEKSNPKELEIHHWRGYDPLFWLDVKFVHASKCHLECENVMPENWT